jgi:predicted RNase H-like HicB family nuclease
MKKRQIAFNIPIDVEKDGERYYAYCPCLKGVHVDGETKEEAIENAKLAAVLYIKSLIKHGEPIPIQIMQPVEIQEPCYKSKSRNVMLSCPPQQTANVLVPI